MSGIVLTFQFGLNWGSYAHDVGPIIGVLIGMEAATAFFLEAGFIGIMLYGEGRVSQHITMFANTMVALETLLSTTWIIDANSWMQTPAGFKRVNGQFEPTDWVNVIFNPSYLHRYFHMLFAALIAASWLVAGISAFYLARRHYLAFSRRTFSSPSVLAVLMPWQLFVGDNVGAVMSSYQPYKVFTWEGNDNSDNSGYNLLIIPDPQAGKDLFQITIPNFDALFGPHDLSGQAKVPGINTIPKDQRPNVYLLFWGFRVMFYGAITMLATAVVGVYLRMRRKSYTSRRYLRWVTWMTPIGVIAIIGGWIVAEAGRDLGCLRATADRQGSVRPLHPRLCSPSLRLSGSTSSCFPSGWATSCDRSAEDPTRLRRSLPTCRARRMDPEHHWRSPTLTVSTSDPAHQCPHDVSTGSRRDSSVL